MSAWLPLGPRRSDAEARLFCFPYSGGGAQVFHRWMRALPERVDVCPVQLPGRWTRLKEQPYTRMEPLIEGLAAALLPLFDKPFALFGHSLGALVAFELARWLRARGATLPRVLFVSARRPPDCAAPFEPIYHLPQREFIEAMQRRYNGIPQALLDAPDLLEVVLPALRADMEVFETYTYRPEPPLPTRLVVLGGSRDAAVDAAELPGWQRQSESAIAVHVFEGGHFFLHEQEAAVLDILRQELRIE